MKIENHKQITHLALKFGKYYFLGNIITCVRYLLK